jgi:anaerobic selenocysteine-containing dehydrogenase
VQPARVPAGQCRVTAAAGSPSHRCRAGQAQEAWRWDKGVCRFCGTGCGIQVATLDNRVVGVKGDPDSPVNRGLLCVKGYANAQILYGADRLTTPLLRMKNGKFDKQGEFAPVSWQRAFDEMAVQFKRAHTELGPTGVAVMGSGQYTIQRLRGGQAAQGRMALQQSRSQRPALHGLGGGGLHADLRHRRARRLLRRHRAHRRHRQLGLEHGRFACWARS